MVGGTFWDDSFEQDRSWDEFGTTHFRDLGHPPKFYRVQDAGLYVVPRFNDKL